MRGALVTSDELDMVETIDLIDALGRRSKHLLVVQCLDRGGDAMTTYYRNGWVGALGLAHYAIHDLNFNTTERKPRTDEA